MRKYAYAWILIVIAVVLFSAATALADICSFSSKYANMSVNPCHAYSSTGSYMQDMAVCSNASIGGYLYVDSVFTKNLTRVSLSLLNSSSYAETDVSNQITKISLNGTSYFGKRYFNPGECAIFRLRYTPAEKNGKWNMRAWVNSVDDYSCVYSGTCVADYEIDPYYNQTPGLAVHYTFNESGINAYNGVGNGAFNNGTANGSVTNCAGKFGTARCFSGASQWMMLDPSNGAFDFAGNFTMLAIVNSSSASSGKVLIQRSSGAHPPWIFGSKNSNNWYDSTSLDGLNYDINNLVQGNFSFPFNWTCLAWSRQGNQWVTQQDNLIIANTTDNNTPPAGSGNVMMAYTGLVFFQGRIDDFAVYNGVSLTQGQITSYCQNAVLPVLAVPTNFSNMMPIDRANLSYRANVNLSGLVTGGSLNYNVNFIVNGTINTTISCANNTFCSSLLAVFPGAYSWAMQDNTTNDLSATLNFVLLNPLLSNMTSNITFPTNGSVITQLTNNINYTYICTSTFAGNFSHNLTDNGVQIDNDTLFNNVSASHYETNTAFGMHNISLICFDGVNQSIANISFSLVHPLTSVSANITFPLNGSVILQGNNILNYTFICVSTYSANITLNLTRDNVPLAYSVVANSSQQSFYDNMLSFSSHNLSLMCNDSVNMSASVSGFTLSLNNQTSGSSTANAITLAVNNMIYVFLLFLAAVTYAIHLALLFYQEKNNKSSNERGGSSLLQLFSIMFVGLTFFFQVSASLVVVSFALITLLITLFGIDLVLRIGGAKGYGKF